jgi:hypothetical protein
MATQKDTPEGAPGPVRSNINRPRRRIETSIRLHSRDDGDTVLHLANPPAGIEGVGMKVCRVVHGESPGAVAWIWIEYIGERTALLTLRGLLPRFFEVGKSGHRRHDDDSGHSVYVDRYAGDRWKLRLDARELESQADVDKCVATYWPERVDVPFMDPARESIDKAINRLAEAAADRECDLCDALDTHLKEIKLLLRRPTARVALDVAIERKLGLAATLKMLRRSHLRLAVDNTRP